MVTRIRAKTIRRKHLYIGEWMEYRGLSDERMAGRLNVSRETVTRWRNQQHRLNPDKIAAIAKALDLEPKELWDPPPRPDVLPRPNFNVLLKDVPTEAAQKLAELLPFIVKTGT